MFMYKYAFIVGQPNDKEKRMIASLSLSFILFIGSLWRLREKVAIWFFRDTGDEGSCYKGLRKNT